MTEQVRVLLISHSAFSKEGANGRTLECLLHQVDTEHLAQLYMSEEQPDYEICNRYFQITDRQVLRAFLKRKGDLGGALEREPKPVKKQQREKKSVEAKLSWIAKKYKHISLIKLFRNYIWKQETWNSEALNRWIDDFAPQVVFMLSGKSEYFHDIALKIAQERHLPLVVYHCEDYYFKNTHPYSLFYQCYRKGLQRSLQRVMEYASLAIYNSPYIQKLYQKEFHTEGYVAYMTTEMLPRPSVDVNNKQFTVSYLGNLANKRYLSLKLFADCLAEVDPTARICVYAPPLGEKERKLFQNCANIEWMGLVPYEICQEVMQKSDLLLHVEDFSKQTQKELRIAFSTKIADCLASGVCFFVFAPEGIACTEYLRETKGACLVTDPERLKEELEKIVWQPELRKAYVETALQIAANNHNKQNTGEGVLRAIGKVQRESQEPND